MRTLLAALCAALCLFTAASAAAQPSSLTGHIVDGQGASVAGADVILTGPATQSTRSRADGSFTFVNVARGSYTLTVHASGFAAASQTVMVGATTSPVTVSLRVAGLQEDVTVEASLGTAATGKTPLPLREQPITVNMVPRAVIDEQGANDLVTALRNVPAVNPFTTYGVYEYYAFRGFLDSVQLVDGVRAEGNRTNTQLTAIDRVEVLKGPSSALYGNSALGGTVNLIRKKPSAAPAYEFMAAAGQWKDARGAFGATGRLAGGTLYRLDLGAESRDGYRHDDVRRFSATPSIANTWGRNQFNVYYTFNRDRFGGDAGLPLVDTSLGVPVEANIPDVPRDRNFRTPQDFALSYDHNFQAVYARQLTNAIGFRDTLSYRYFDDEYFLTEENDFIAPDTVDRYYLYFKHHRRPLMNLAEVTAGIPGTIEQNLLFGWESQRYHNYTTLPEEDFFQAASINAFNPVDTQGPSDLTPVRQNVFTNTTNAFYAQDHLTLSPQIKALVGGRFDLYRRNSHSDDLVNGNAVAGPVTRRETNAFTGRAGLVYQPSVKTEIYGSLANAFKPSTNAQPDGTTLDPETGYQIEVGNRWHLLQDRVQLTGDVYRIVRQNVAFRRPGNVFVLAGEVESRGVEFDVETSPTLNWRINAGYGFTDARFNDFEQTVGENLRDNTPTFAPRHTLNIWTGYNWANGVGVNAGVRYFGKVFADNENLFEVDGYGTLSLAARYTRGALEYAVNINNVTSTKYFTPHQDYLQVYPGEPINVLATVRVRLK
ncbi:MAG TPA: TonB-dependent receptor [Vicinamibacterales bacterium]|nr:TonB-dependent receptor [Vicinamibacterales bacterium]